MFSRVVGRVSNVFWELVGGGTPPPSRTRFRHTMTRMIPVIRRWNCFNKPTPYWRVLCHKVTDSSRDTREKGQESLSGTGLDEDWAWHAGITGHDGIIRSNIALRGTRGKKSRVFTSIGFNGSGHGMRESKEHDGI